ncbi:SET domain [Trypanosoma vivax]|nr:SET domain [Trypanosoma vivax]
METKETTSVRYIDGRRGRGLIAEADFEANDTILCVPYDIAVLYSPFVRNTCYRCFDAVPEKPRPTRPASGSRRRKQEDGFRYECSACQHLVLCPACTRELVAEVRASPSGGALAKLPAQQLTVEQQTQLLEIHALLKVHRIVCKWFCALPPSMREGDTDYLRFALQYGARALMGDTRLLLGVGELCTNTTEQSPESREFCTSFARRVVDTFSPHGFCVDADHLRDVLLRTKCNSIGYPFNETETLGWLMQEKLCMINHSCDPNAAIVRPRASAAGTGKTLCCVELLARRSIKSGEEITISYIDVDSFGDNTQERRRHLLESYWFLCMCSRCEAAGCADNNAAGSVATPAPHTSTFSKNKIKRRKNGRQW